MQVGEEGYGVKTQAHMELCHAEADFTVMLQYVIAHDEVDYWVAKR